MNVVDPLRWNPSGHTVIEREMTLSEIALKTRVGRFCDSFQCVRCKRGATFACKTHPKNHPEAVRHDAFTADGIMMTVDHIIPRSWGGSTNRFNLRPMCYKCNCKRGDKITIDEILEVKHNLFLMVEHWEIFYDKMITNFSAIDLEKFAA